MTSAAATSRPKALRLSREVLVEACMHIADRDGPDAVTLRRLGSELGIDPTAVYRHFRDKSELLVAMADRLLIEVLDGFDPVGAPRADLRRLSIRARKAYLAHPRLASLVAHADSPLPSESRIAELTLHLLRQLGLPADEAALAFQALEGYTAGSSSLDAAGEPGGGEAWRRAFAVLPQDDYPNLAVAAPLLYREDDAAFEFGLDLMLDAIEARTAKAR
jgi:TetR/AcrR family tetracycline transcriptional repressor